MLGHGEGGSLGGGSGLFRMEIPWFGSQAGSPNSLMLCAPCGFLVLFFVNNNIKTALRAPAQPWGAA